MQHDGEVGQTLFDLLQDVEAELRLGAGLELIGAVAGSDGDRQAVHAGAGDKVQHLVGIGVGSVLGVDLDRVLDARQATQLALDDHAVIVRVFDDLAGERHVLLVGSVGAVDHHGGEAAVDAALAQLEAVAVIEMYRDGQSRLDDGRLDELHEVGMVGVLAGACGHLQDQRGALLLGRLGDALNDLHVVDVEGADGVAALVGLLKHLFCRYDRHDLLSFI